MKTLQITIIVVLTISTILTTGVFAQNTGSVALVFLRPDKEIYFPGDSIFIHGQDDMNVTSITIGLEKNHKLMTMSEESQVLQNGTFYANFTLPKDPDAQYWSLVSGPLVQDLYFKPVYLSPLKQFKSGISPLNVKCSANYALVIKKEDGSPACVQLNDTDNLMNKGWAINQFIVSEVYVNQGISVIQRDTGLLKYENGTFVQYMSIYVFINNFTKSDSQLQVKVLHDDVPYRTDVVSSADVLPDGFYKYQFVLNHAIFGSYKIIATYENRTSQTSFVIGIPP